MQHTESELYCPTLQAQIYKDNGVDLWSGPAIVEQPCVFLICIEVISSDLNDVGKHDLILRVKYTGEEYTKYADAPFTVDIRDPCQTAVFDEAQ